MNRKRALYNFLMNNRAYWALGGGTLSEWYALDSFELNGVRPTLAVDFINNRYYSSVRGETSMPFTNTRTTNATMFDANGNLVWAPHNLAPTPSGASYTVTLNPVGVSGPNGEIDGVRKLTATGVDPSFGNTTTTASQFLGQRASYTISCWVKGEDTTVGKTGRFFMYRDGVTDVQSSVTFTITGAWRRVSATYSFTTAPTTNTTFRIDLPDTAVIGEVVYVYGWQVERAAPNTPTAYIDNAGVAVYKERYDYDPLTLVERGLLVEDNRTNLCTASLNEGTTSGATAVQGTLSVGSSMFGTNSVLFTADGVSAQHYVYGGSLLSAPPATTAVTASCYVRAGTATRVQFRVSGNWGDGANGYVNVNLSTKAITVTGSAVTNARVIDCGNNILRIELTSTTTAVPTAGAPGVLTIITSDTSLVNEINTSSGTIETLGWQLEVGGFATSLIPTGGSAAARASDIISVPVGSWLNQTKGTIYLNFVRGYVAAAAGPTSAVFAELRTDTSNRLFLTSGQGTHSQHRFDVLVGNVYQAQVQSSTGSTSFQNRKMVALYNTSLFRTSENGGTATGVATGTVPGVTEVYLGSSNGSAGINGWIKEFRYYPDSSASDAQLQAITA